MPESLDRRELLARLPLFERLGPHEIGELLRVTTTRKLDARETLFRKGDPGDQLFVLIEGRLKAVAGGGEGKEVVFALMEPPEVIGEISVVDAQSRSATIVALEPTVLLSLHRRDLLPLAERYPRIAFGIAEALAAKLRRLSEYVEDASFRLLPSRLAKRLLDLSDSVGRPRPEGIWFELRLHQQELGELVGTTRESINKLLRQWAQLGVVTFEGGHVTIVDRDELQQIAKLD